MDNPPKPTESELAILRVLWAKGPQTVRHVHAELSRQRDLGYTTVLKLLQIMHDKGLVERDTAQRSHIYRAHAQQQPTERQLVRDLLERVFDGSAQRLVLHALSAAEISAEERAEIQRLLAQAEDEEEPS